METKREGKIDGLIDVKEDGGGKSGEPEKEAMLKVGELTEIKDYGRGLARISREAMKRLGASEGDVIEIEGNHRTVVVALNAYSGEAHLGIVRMDGLTRRNCKAVIGEQVKVRRADVKEARLITIAPVRKGIVIRMSAELMKRNILMRPFVTGDILVPNPVVKPRRESTMFEEFFGTDFENFPFAPFGEEKFIIVSTDPNGPVRVTRNTEIKLLPTATAGPEANISSENIVDVDMLPDMKRFIRVKSAEDIAKIAKMGYPVGKHQTRRETTLISGIYYWSGRKEKEKRKKNQDGRGKNEIADGKKRNILQAVA